MWCWKSVLKTCFGIFSSPFWMIYYINIVNGWSSKPVWGTRWGSLKCRCKVTSSVFLHVCLLVCYYVRILGADMKFNEKDKVMDLVINGHTGMQHTHTHTVPCIQPWSFETGPFDVIDPRFFSAAPEAEWSIFFWLSSYWFNVQVVKATHLVLTTLI